MLDQRESGAESKPINEARRIWQIFKIGLTICVAMAFFLGLSYAMGVGFAQGLQEPVEGKSSPGVFLKVVLAVFFGSAVGAGARWLASPRPAWMGAIITVCSVVFLFGFFPGSKVVPRPSFLFPFVFIVVIFAVAFFRIRKAKA